MNKGIFMKVGIVLFCMICAGFADTQVYTGIQSSGATRVVETLFGSGFCGSTQVLDFSQSLTVDSTQSLTLVGYRNFVTGGDGVSTWDVEGLTFLNASGVSGSELVGQWTTGSSVVDSSTGLLKWPTVMKYNITTQKDSSTASANTYFENTHNIAGTAGVWSSFKTVMTSDEPVVQLIGFGKNLAVPTVMPTFPTI